MLSVPPPHDPQSVAADQFQSPLWLKPQPKLHQLRVYFKVPQSAPAQFLDCSGPDFVLGSRSRPPRPGRQQFDGGGNSDHRAGRCSTGPRQTLLVRTVRGPDPPDDVPATASVFPTHRLLHRRHAIRARLHSRSGPGRHAAHAVSATGAAAEPATDAGQPAEAVQQPLLPGRGRPSLRSLPSGRSGGHPVPSATRPAAIRLSPRPDAVRVRSPIISNRYFITRPRLFSEITSLFLPLQPPGLRRRRTPRMPQLVSTSRAWGS